MPPKKLTIFTMNLVFIHNKYQFELIQTDQILKHDNKQKCFDKSQINTQIGKSDIIVPKCGKISIYNEFKNQQQKSNKLIQTSGYVRLCSSKNLPNPFIYQLTEQDLKALELIKRKYDNLKDMKFQFDSKKLSQFYKLCQDFCHSKSKIQRKIFSNQLLMAQILVNKLCSQFENSSNQNITKLMIDLFKFWKLTKKQRNNLSLIRNYYPRQETSDEMLNASIPFKIRMPHILKSINKFKNQRIAMGVSVKNKKSNQQDLVINSIEEWEGLYKNLDICRRKFIKYTKCFHTNVFKYGYKHPLYFKDMTSIKQNNLTTSEFLNPKNIKTNEKIKSQKFQQALKNLQINIKSNNNDIKYLNRSANSTSDSIQKMNYSQNQTIIYQEVSQNELVNSFKEFSEEFSFNATIDESFIQSSQQTMYSSRVINLDQDQKRVVKKRIKRK